ncbi:hypothetical protein C8F04DRAFT_1192338 [Mycena alexandri]|uniref:Uncharacterized protein n=1 Tax=Mycena alexandri TaxID=1745969 RepID=A0AAD6SBJ3_9AGAR|nr:hypothetical protein C8F04DRAFT_1192338 [Mycena alexandri]
MSNLTVHSSCWFLFPLFVFLPGAPGMHQTCPPVPTPPVYIKYVPPCPHTTTMVTHVPPVPPPPTPSVVGLSSDRHAWAIIPVGLYTHPQYIQFCIKKAGEIPLTLYFNLVQYGAQRPGSAPGKVPPTPAEMANTIFPLLTQVTRPSLIQEVFVRSTHTDSCANIISWLGRLDNRALRRAAMVLDAPLDRTEEVLMCAPLSFPGTPSMLSELRLGQSIPPWQFKLQAVYQNLSVLRLTSFLGGRMSTRMEISDALGAMKRLTLLELSNVECKDTFPEDEPNPFLPLLTDLILSFSHPSSAEFVSHIDMPALRRLRLDIYSARRSPRPTIESFVRVCHHFLRFLTVLDLRHVTASRKELELFFATMSDLRILDVGRGTQKLTEELLSLMVDRVAVIKNLTIVRFGGSVSNDNLLSLLRTRSWTRDSSIISHNLTGVSGFAQQEATLQQGSLVIVPLIRPVRFGDWYQ